MLRKQMAMLLAVILSANVSYGHGCGCAAGNVGMCPWEIASAAAVSVVPTYITDAFFDPKVSIPAALSGVAVALAVGSSPAAMMIGVPSTLFFVKNALAVIVPAQEEDLSKFVAEKLLPLGTLGIVSGVQWFLRSPPSCGSESALGTYSQRLQKNIKAALMGAIGEVVFGGAFEYFGVTPHIKGRVWSLKSRAASAFAQFFSGSSGHEYHDHHDHGSAEVSHDHDHDHHDQDHDHTLCYLGK